MTGQLIVFEGIDGCGKTTQLSLLADWLSQQPWPDAPRRIVKTKEPGATQLGGSLRQLLLTPNAAEAMDPIAELLLYAADRAQHVACQLRPELEAGSWVLCDRYEDSTWAYQGLGRGLDLALIEELNRIATGGLSSDLTLWLDLDPEETQRRLRDRGAADRMEQADFAFHQRVRQGFAQLAERHPERIRRIDAHGEPDQVALRIQRVLSQWMETQPKAPSAAD
jgi:dTMP kinase